MTYIDLFSGAGGLALGFDNEGFKNIFSLDMEPSFCETYRENFPKHRLIEKNITDLSEQEILKITNNIEVDVIVGGPPCQGFSMAGNVGRKFIDDPRNHLFKEFARIVEIVKPNYFVMENVARLYTHNQGKTKENIIARFNKIGYNVECKILNTADYGIPQIRKRVIFIGRKKGNEILFPSKEVDKYMTIKEAIDDLSNPNLEKNKIFNHVIMDHSEQMLLKMSYVSDGGNREEIPKSIRPKKGDIRKYIRYNSNTPSICITGDMRKVFHYSENRALTVRELARIQSFPDNFVFKGSRISQQQQVGNAVAPLMARAIAKSIKKMKLNDSIKAGKKEEGLCQSNKIIQNSAVFPKVNFIGNKEKIADRIGNHFPKDARSIFDAFSGGGSVSYQAKKKGLKVISNDILEVNYLLAKSIIENNTEKLTKSDVDLIFSGKPIKGFMYNNYSNVYFFPEECMELDLYRKNIEKLSSEYKKAMALTLLRRAMIRKMPYSRFNLDWDKIKQLRDEEYSYEKYKRKRAYHNESFKNHFGKNLEEYNKAVFDNGQKNMAYNDDVFELLSKIKADIIYLDPPYTGTMNNYHGFYGIIDNYIKGMITKPFKNNFINKEQSIILFDRLFSKLGNFKYWMLSYNNGSYPDKNQLISIISKYSKRIKMIEKDHAYQITGKKNKKKNIEYLFIIENRTN